ncbi:S8 family serine peptidase [Candidatus Enterococcus murrayae]|uniref:Peptidase S8/S53 domain-containing protein n=1 Tax=Candidatus Enterococcus murrayae TaxID=2815321 RepID=A0ABS3HJT4_9ENTE|nr:S8 family serine peptidase [Enterococcus sp. MJM16]MBO0453272.1 hypothetical protein [Enterococcus sp. MJM16]
MKRMKKISLIVLAGLAALFVIVAIYILWIQPIDSRTKGTEVGIARKTTADTKKVVKMKKIAQPNTNFSSFPQLDLRSKDLSKLDLTHQQEKLDYAIFDSATKWPKKLPAGFDSEACLAFGKNPGLHVRDLHQAGITGKGVSIGIIDHTLFTEHEQYADRLKHYEEIHLLSKTPEMHGAAVASLALGKTTGVAPEAHLYYIAAGLSNNLGAMMLNKANNDSAGNMSSKGFTYKYYAQAIERFLELNQTLPEKEKIRVISISRGFNKKDDGYDLFQRALKKAKEQQVLVVTASLDKEYGIGLAGLGRKMMADPDELGSYSVGSWIKEEAASYQECLFLPMDGRTYAGVYGRDNYQYDTSGGISWTVPYLAGLYALAYQVNPAITPEVFLTQAVATSNAQTVENKGKPFRIKQIIDPEQLIYTIKNE